MNLIELREKLVEVQPQDAEEVVFDFLSPVLTEQGYELDYRHGIGDNGIDFVAKGQPPLAEKIGFQVIHRRNPLGRNDVQRLLGVALTNPVDQTVLISTSGFNHSAQELAAASYPVQIQLLDVVSLSAWADRQAASDPIKASPVLAAVKKLSKELAEAVALDPRALDDIEWRLFEHMLAEVFEGLGFKVELTPSAKDGGRDIVLRCKVSGHGQTYFVEAKHWRSGQRVGRRQVRRFVEVVASESVDGGLLLSSSGVSPKAISSLSQIDIERVHLGVENKVVALCKQYVRAEAQIWTPVSDLPDLLFDGTTRLGSVQNHSQKPTDPQLK